MANIRLVDSLCCPMASARKQHVIAGVFLLFIFVHLMLYVQRMPLFHEEPRRSIVTQEMITNDNYIVPTIYGRPYLRKPPIQNWLIASVSPGGEVTRFSARLVSVLSLMVIGLAVYLVLLPVRREQAFVGLLFALGNYMLLCEYGNKVEPDIIITALTLLSVIAYLKGPRRIGWILLSALFMGLGILTKGLSPVYFYPAAIVLAAFKRDERWSRIGWLLAHVLLSMVLPLLWIWLYSKQADLGRLLGIYAQEVGQRTESQILAFLKHLIEFPAKTLVMLLPAPLLLVFAKRRNVRKDDLYWISLLIFLISFLIFTLAPGSRDRYLMPAYPFFAIFASYLVDWEKRPRGWVRVLVYSLVGLVGVGGGVFLALHGYAAQAGILVLSGVLAVALMLRKEQSVVGMTFAATVLYLMIFIHGLYFFRTTVRYDYRSAALQMVEMMDEDLPIAVGRGIRFQIGMRLESHLDRPVVLARDHKDWTDFYFISYPAEVDSAATVLLEVPYKGPDKTMVLQRISRSR